MNEQISLASLVDLSGIANREAFAEENAFSYLGKSLTQWLQSFLRSKGVTDQPIIKGQVSPLAVVEGAVYVEAGAIIEPGAYVQGPAYIGAGAEIRHCAYIRGSVYVGPKAVVGHTTEVKGSIFFDHAKAGHFAYVGDSLLGRDVNLGAGTKLANLKLRGDEVKVRHPRGGRLPSGLRKLGALLGDKAQTGCNAVLSPGTILMPGTAVLPCVHYHGTLLEGSAKGHP